MIYVILKNRKVLRYNAAENVLIRDGVADVEDSENRWIAKIPIENIERIESREAMPSTERPTRAETSRLLKIEQFDRRNRMNSSAGQSVGEPAAKEIVQFASRLAEVAETLAAQIHEKLHPVMLSDGPTLLGVAVKQPREYPPLFEELRNRLQVIEKSLCSIREAIARTAL